MEFSQHDAIIWTVVVIKSSFGFLPSPQTAHKFYIQTRHFYSLLTINFKFKAFFVLFFGFFLLAGPQKLTSLTTIGAKQTQQVPTLKFVELLFSQFLVTHEELHYCWCVLRNSDNFCKNLAP